MAHLAQQEHRSGVWAKEAEGRGVFPVADGAGLAVSGAATDRRKKSCALPLLSMSFQASNSTCLCLFLLATISSMCFTLRSSLLHFWSRSSEGFKLRPHFYQNAVHAAKQELARKKRPQGSAWTVGKEGGNQKPELQAGKIQALQPGCPAHRNLSLHPWMPNGLGDARVNTELSLQHQLSEADCSLWRTGYKCPESPMGNQGRSNNFSAAWFRGVEGRGEIVL